MKLYLAGTYANRQEVLGKVFREKFDDRERAARLGVRYFLESYHYVDKQSYVERIRADKTQVFLDSGAFSAWTKGVEIDLEGYCEYIKRNQDIIENVGGSVLASVLDGIGDPKKTLENQQKMEQLGVTPLPCFHFGEPDEYLVYYASKYPYITIGGMVGKPAPQLRAWLDYIWDKYLTDDKGVPTLKVHGFGLTNIEFMGRYPWYSVDSSSWIQYALNGLIYPPALRKSLMISEKKGSRKEAGQHYLSVSDFEREHLKSIILKDGFDPRRMETLDYARGAYNQWAYTVINDEINARATNFIAEQPGLF